LSLQQSGTVLSDEQSEVPFEGHMLFEQSAFPSSGQTAVTVAFFPTIELLEVKASKETDIATIVAITMVVNLFFILVQFCRKTN